MANSKYFLEVKGLKKHFPSPRGTVHAVDNLNFGIEKGKTLGIVGESGCGKSTTGRAITRLHTPTAGQVFIDGEDVTAYNHKEYNKKVRTRSQFIFQDPLASLNPRMNVRKLIGEPYRINFKRTEYKEYADAWKAYYAKFKELTSTHPEILEIKSVLNEKKAKYKADMKHLATLKKTKILDLNDVEKEDHQEKVVNLTKANEKLQNEMIAHSKEIEDIIAGLSNSDKELKQLKVTKDSMFEKYGIKEVGKLISYKQFVERKVLLTLRRVGLQKRVMNAYPHELDGGSRQRVGIARSLILNPEFICCDEPTSALDVSVQASVLNTLKDLQKERKLTYIFITHDLAVVKHISDDIMVMYLGQAVEKTSSDALFKSPKHPYTQALLSAIPSPDPNKKLDPILTEGELTSPIDPKPGCRFAPRCPKVMDICKTKDPILTEISKDHFVSCHLFNKKVSTVKK